MSSTTSVSSIRFYTGGHMSALRGYVYANTSNEIGFLNSGGNWGLRMDNSYNVQIYGALTVGNSTSSDIYMTDTDENTRRIHTNSGRIGFLNTSSSWGAYCDNSGNWFSDHSMRAPIFYDSNDTAYYLNPAGGSRLRNLYVGDSGDDWSDPGGWGTQVRFSNSPHVKFVLHARSPGIEAGMYVHTPSSVYIGSYTGHDVSMMWAGSRRMVIANSYIYTDVYLEAAGSLRAPIFYDSNDTGYYLDPNDTSNLSRLIVNNAVSGAALLIGSTNTSRVINDNARKALVINAEYYPGLHLNAYAANNSTHGAYIVMSGNLSAGGYRLWTMGIANLNPGIFSIGYSDQQDGNGHYGVGDGWSGSDVHHGRLIIDTSGNTKIRGMLYVNGTSGGMSTGNAVIHAGNIGSQSVNYANSAGSVSGGLTTSNYTSTLDGRYFFDYGFTEGYPGTNANNMPSNRSAFTYSNGAPLTGCVAHFGAAGYGIQLNGDYGGDSFSMRSRNGDNGTWKAWKRLLTDYNYTSYSPTLTGGGASGTWSINVTGSAGSLSGFDKTNPSFGAVYANNWFRVYGDVGLYSQDYGGHFRRNASSSHGTWEIFGYAKGGYNGLLIKDDAGYFSNYMHEGGNGGLYCENQGGRWPWYWHRGNVCLGLGDSSTSSSYRVYVNGSLYATGDITAYSDRRKKTDITTIDNALDKVTQLRGVYYTKIDEVEKGRQTGVIAQEINEVLPEVVTYAADVDEYGVKYGNIVGVLIEAIKELKAEIDELKSQK
jgi:hypothetical protein